MFVYHALIKTPILGKLISIITLKSPEEVEVEEVCQKSLTPRTVHSFTKKIISCPT